MTYQQVTISRRQRDFFEENGYLSIKGLLDEYEVKYFADIYDCFISGTIEVRGLNRGDLAGKMELKDGQSASILQILAPSLYFPELKENIIEQRALLIARQLLGDDLIIDFDELLCKMPFTGKATPWHQDQAYWPDLPDKRAISCWVALDEAIIENGCMQFIPGSHKLPLKPHARAYGDPESRALETVVDPGQAVAVPLNPGDCVFHQGRSLHYTGPNLTSSWRRAFIVAFRPAEMVAVLRSQGFYHYVPDPELNA